MIKFETITKRFHFMLTMLVLNGISYSIHALTLEGISHSVLPGNNIQLKIDLSEAMEQEPLNFTIENPARIVLDFPDTNLGNNVQKNHLISTGVVNSVSAVEAAGRTRVVLNLTDTIAYKVDTQGNVVTVALGSGQSAPLVSNIDHAIEKDIVREKGGDGIQQPALTDIKASIKNIDFRRGENGEGKVIVDLSVPSINVDLKQVGDSIELSFVDTELPNELDRKLDVVDFATPVKQIDSTIGTNGAQMSLLIATPNYDHIAYQVGDTFILEVHPLKEDEQGGAGDIGFTGERLSLNFQDIEVRAVLQLIADFTGLNMVASDTVAGNVTLRLKNVPWDQALDIVLKSKGLGLRKIDNVIMVAPNAEITAREKLELEASKHVKELAPLRTEFIQVNYAKASEIADLMKAEGNNLLSERGSVTVDERTNTLIVQDVAESLESIRGLLLKLDIPVRQVLIESRIVNADEEFVEDIGVRFGYSKNTKQGNALTREDIGDGNNNPFVIFTGGNEGNIEGSAGTGIATGGAENLIVDLAAPSGSAAASLIIGKIGSYLLQLELSALIADGRGENIASPKIITANQRQARIESGIEIPFQEASSSGATTTAFKQAVLALDVTPQITPDDRVLLDLNVSQDTPGSPIIGGIPINTRRVSTQVLVDNGETVVLGGIYTLADSKAADKVPFFADLPYVGFLFKRTNVTKRKAELLIFVTPKILQDNIHI